MKKVPDKKRDNAESFTDRKKDDCGRTDRGLIGNGKKKISFDAN